MTGQLLGARFGVEGVRHRWLELRELITQVADDVVTEWRGDAEWWGRYPGFWFEYAVTFGPENAFLSSLLSERCGAHGYCFVNAAQFCSRHGIAQRIISI